jgi:hypothetical protein
MKPFFTVLIFLFISSAICSQNIRILSPEKMQADFIQFRKIIEENQVNLYDYTPKKAMDRLFDNQFARIKDSLPMNEFFKLMTPIIAATGNGHTNIWMPGEYWRSGNDKFFPVQIKVVEDKIVAKGSYTETEQLPRGSIIHKINDVPIQEIADEMIENYYAEGKRIHGKIVGVERRFPMIYVRRFGFPDEYIVTYSLPGEKKKIKKTLVPATEKEVRDIVFSNFDTTELKLEFIDDEMNALLTVETFIYYDERDYFNNFMDSCFKEIKKNNTSNLIIDTRGNDGGDPYCAAELFSYLEHEPLPYFREAHRYARLLEPIPVAENNFKGNLIVLMDSHCFSTNSHFCSLIKYHKLATIVGTPSAGNYRCTNVQDTNLDNTGIMVYYGNSNYSTAVDMDKTKPIMPDILIQETYDDFMKGRDLYMEKALKLIK